jgi:hypothetical protein
VFSVDGPELPKLWSEASRGDDAYGKLQPGLPRRCLFGVVLGYARVSTRVQDHQAQLDALAVAHCREVGIETASTCGDRPKPYAPLARLQAGDTWWSTSRTGSPAP